MKKSGKGTPRSSKKKKKEKGKLIKDEGARGKKGNARGAGRSKTGVLLRNGHTGEILQKGNETKKGKKEMRWLGQDGKRLKRKSLVRV